MSLGRRCWRPTAQVAQHVDTSIARGMDSLDSLLAALPAADAEPAVQGGPLVDKLCWCPGAMHCTVTLQTDKPARI